MQVITILIILAILAGVGLIGALAMMQARRFKYLSKPSQIISWAYMLISIILAVSIIITVFTIDF